MTIKQNKEPFTCPDCGAVVEFTLARLAKYKSCAVCGWTLSADERKRIKDNIEVRQVVRKLDRKKEPRPA